FESLTRRSIFVAVLLAVVAFILVSRQIPLKAYFAGPVPSLIMIVLIYGLTWVLLRQMARPSLRNYGKFVRLSIVLASFVVSISFSAHLMDLTYDSTWSPQSVEKIASYLKTQTSHADEVMSGAVIWELQAQRRPFHMVSHPLGFEYGISEGKKAAIELAAATRPPKAIVLDGNTETTYMRHIPSLMELLEAKYRLLATVGPASYPIRVYLHDESASWPFKSPAELGLDGAKLDQFAAKVGGVGCIVKDGYMIKSWGDQTYKKASWKDLWDWGSAVKPVMSTMLFFAVHEGKLSSVDARIRDWGWELIEKDQPMTFRHVANMISGYARVEAPGKAWAYNDFGISLYSRTLFDRVFKQSLDDVIKTRLTALQFQDGPPFFGSPTEVITARDFVRIGWLWLNKGNWKGQQLLPRQFFDDYLKPQVPRDLPRSSAAISDYLGIKSMGGSADLALSDSTLYGPGIYGFNWWFNTKVGTLDNLVWPDAPADTFMANGYFNRSIVTIIPSLGLVVAARGNWGDFKPSDRTSGMNQNLKLLVDAVTPSRLQ
ncbi:MAG TPA: serine hydrolase, partial [Nitrospiraceae bacterium]|nr:serine hydrolase [Nitrospiraceae bacterium]